MLRDYLPATIDRVVEGNKEPHCLLCPYTLRLSNPRCFSAMCPESVFRKQTLHGQEYFILGDFFPVLTNRLIGSDEFLAFLLESILLRVDSGFLPSGH